MELRSRLLRLLSLSPRSEWFLRELRLRLRLPREAERLRLLFLRGEEERDDEEEDVEEEDVDTVEEKDELEEDVRLLRDPECLTSLTSDL